MRRIWISVMIVGGMLLATMAPGAAEEPDGAIRITSRSIAPAVGLTWGDGVLTYKGKDYPFSFDAAGLSREVNVDMDVAELSGEVFNLKSLEDFNGNYMGVSTEPTGEVTRATIKNQQGVVINIVAKTPGVKFSLGPGGLKIELKKE